MRWEARDGREDEMLPSARTDPLLDLAVFSAFTLHCPKTSLREVLRGRVMASIWTPCLWTVGPVQR